MFSFTIPTWGLYLIIAGVAILIKVLVVFLVVRKIVRVFRNHSNLRATRRRADEAAKAQQKNTEREDKERAAIDYAEKVLGHWLPLFKAIHLANGWVVRASLVDTYLTQDRPKDLTVEGLNLIRTAFWQDHSDGTPGSWERIGAKLAVYVRMD